MKTSTTAMQQISYNVRQAYEATGISEPTLRRLVRENKISARYLGSTVLIIAESLQRYFESLPSERQVERECAANRGSGARPLLQEQPGTATEK